MNTSVRQIPSSESLGLVKTAYFATESSYSYVYDTDATCGTSQGDLVKRTDPAGNVTCFAYDAFHRVTALTYPSGPNAGVTPEKHFVYDAATVNGVIMANAKGRLAQAYTGPSGSKITDLGFSYSARGEVVDVFQSTSWPPSPPLGLKARVEANKLKL